MAYYPPEISSQKAPNPELQADTAVSMDNVAEHYPTANPPPAYNREPTTSVNYVVRKMAAFI